MSDSYIYFINAKLFCIFILLSAREGTEILFEKGWYHCISEPTWYEVPE